MPEQFSDNSMINEVFAVGRQYPDLPAYEFMGFRRSFRAFECDVRAAARAFFALGIRRGDRVMLSLPNVPQAVVLFYALNLIGAVACMTHPLSSAEEMAELLGSAKPRAFVTLYQFYEKFRPVLDEYKPEFTILTGPADALPAVLAKALSFREKIPPKGTGLLRYNEFLRRGKASPSDYEYSGRGGDVAAVLYSGGTSGKTKGILLTNLNFNAQAQLTAEAGDCLIPNTKFLAVMPIFHGFGLGVCIHTALLGGVTCLLVPRFTVASYAKLLKKRRPNYIAGVPTLFEALLRLPKTEKLDLSPLRGVFSGGDSMLP
ncbi:MAG: AMP-binding protein, partial [Oscillospiraceae bacterium]|nr:AMP-binding protein [Oscillospiraceae bacterium]